MKEAAQSSTVPVSSHSAGSGNAAAAAVAAGGTSSVATLDHQCCHQHHMNRQHLVQQKLQQLHQQLQQAAGHSAIDSLQQVTATDQLQLMAIFHVEMAEIVLKRFILNSAGCCAMERIIDH